MNLPLFTLRFLKALRYGVLFPGTSRFSMPRRIRLCGRAIPLSFPPEPMLKSDFINVILDDDYGVGKLKQEPGTILDVGANIGLFSLWARHHFPRASILAYEPNPAICTHSRRNLEPLGIRCIQAGLAARAGRAVLTVDEDSRNIGIVARADGDVDIRPLGDAIDQLGGQVDLAKIDCEGSEWSLFEAGDDFRRIRNVRMEYHLWGGHLPEELNRIAKALGFRVTHTAPRTGNGIIWMERID